jgi:hypothetical protein
VAGVLDEPYSQLSPLSGVAVQARRQSTCIGWNRVHPKQPGGPVWLLSPGYLLDGPARPEKVRGQREGFHFNKHFFDLFNRK